MRSVYATIDNPFTPMKSNCISHFQDCVHVKLMASNQWILTVYGLLIVVY